MSQHIVQLTAVVAVLPLALAAGCASSDAKRAARAQLERAEAAYRQAQADPSVQAYAPLRLMDAEKALQAAQQAKDSDDKMHLGYLAERKAQLASVTGATAKTEQGMQQLRQETADVLLQKRDRELTVARRETDVKTREAEQARRAAEARARDAEARARELEQGRRQADEIDSKAAALANELQNLKAQRTDRGVVLTIGDVLFAAGKAEVGPGAQRSVDKLADFLKAYPKRTVLIEGHSDNLGHEEYNIRLSQQRAEAVRDLLVARGVAVQRIRTKGYGSKFPIVDNESAVGRQQNRRVEVIVLNEGTTADGSSQ
ncbi:MAG TPA: OmpA family protein [Methylomirabilota bacterium]|nr:OmpA family protein [Methylomirabilota bacterium]